MNFVKMGGKMSIDGGYDVKFFEEVPEDLLCIVCHLALRRPVQVIECGHKFCECCFEKMKTYAVSSATDMLCPLDREIIDLSKCLKTCPNIFHIEVIDQPNCEVFPDRCYERKVLDLQVKCDNVEKSCEWTGDLRLLQVHLNADCLYQVDTCRNLGCDAKMERVKLNEHMQTCEQVASGIVIDSLTQLIKENDLKYTSNMEKFQNILTTQTVEINRCNKTINEQNDKLQRLENKVENQEKELDKCMNKIQKMQDDSLRKVQKSTEQQKYQLTKEGSRGPSGASHFSAGGSVQDQKPYQSLKKKINEPSSNRSGEITNQHKQEIERCREITLEQAASLRSLESMLNILSERNPVFVWKITDYWDIPKCRRLCSPIFFTSMKGHRVFLYIYWSGRHYGSLSLGLSVCHTQYFEELQWPLSLTFECISETGIINSHSLDYYPTEEELNVDTNLITGRGCEVNNFLFMPMLKYYIIDNILNISCWFD